MTQRLLPWRICLLVVLEMYCNGRIPSQGQMTVLTFITSRILPVGALKLEHGPYPPSTSAVTLEHFQNLLAPLKKSPSSLSAWEEFCATVSSISDLDKWFDFVKSITKLFTARQDPETKEELTTIAVPSLFGTAVRQAYIDFKKLDFQDAVRLWQAFEVFVAPISTRDQADDAILDKQLKEDVLSLDRASGGRISEILQDNGDSGGRGSRQHGDVDVERLLSFQIDQMQRLGNRLPESLRAHLKTTIEAIDAESNLSNYVEFLDSWYAGDYASSFESLHRYYDYAMLHKDRSQYQYALLNTAILQADFGCHEEALSAMKETISTARENKDMACLNFSLSWLYHFRTIYGRAVKGSADGQLLASDIKSLSFLKTKSIENKMWSVASLTTLNEARLYLSQGRRPLEAIQRIYESSQMNVDHNLGSVRGSQLLIQSSLHARLGIRSLATAHNELVSDGFLDGLPAEDSLRARCRLASVHASAGNYKEASDLLNAIKPEVHRTLKHHQVVTLCSSMIELKRALHHGDLDAAEHILASVKSSPQTDTDATFQLAFLEIDYFRRRKEFEKAFELINKLAEENDDEGRGSASADVFHRMRLMCKKAQVFAQIGKPQKGLSLSLRATAAALEAKLLPPLWEACGVLAGALVGIGEVGAALDLLSAVTWQATETEDAALTGFLQSTYSNALMTAATSNPREESKNVRIREALDWAGRAHDTYAKLEDYVEQREMCVHSAAAMQLLGDEEGAEKQHAAASRLGEQLRSASGR